MDGRKSPITGSMLINLAVLSLTEAKLAMVTRLDGYVGQLLTHLKKNGARPERTLVIFTATTDRMTKATTT